MVLPLLPITQPIPRIKLCVEYSPNDSNSSGIVTFGGTVAQKIEVKVTRQICKNTVGVGNLIEVPSSIYFRDSNGVKTMSPPLQWLEYKPSDRRVAPPTQFAYFHIDHEMAEHCESASHKVTSEAYVGKPGEIPPHRPDCDQCTLIRCIP